MMREGEERRAGREGLDVKKYRASDNKADVDECVPMNWYRRGIRWISAFFLAWINGYTTS